jgi:GGDEF domain-containing protein
MTVTGPADAGNRRKGASQRAYDAGMSSHHPGGGAGREEPALPQQYSGMPGSVWMLLLWHMLAALLVLASLVRPADPGDFVAVRIGVLIYLVVAVMTMLGLREKTPPLLLQVFLILNIFAVSVMVAAASQPIGSVTYSLCYSLVALYSAFWSTKRLAVIVMATITLSYLAAIIITDRFTQLLPAWVAISALCIAIVAVTHILISGLERVAVIDPLTGVMSPLGLQTLAQLMPKAGRINVPRTLVVIDIDDFANYNEVHGRDAGDYVLKAIGSALREELRGDDVIARIGYDEFMFVLMLTDVAEAPPIVGRLRDATPISWTAGVVDWPLDEKYEDALRRARSLLDEERSKTRAQK